MARQTTVRADPSAVTSGVSFFSSEKGRPDRPAQLLRRVLPYVLIAGLLLSVSFSAIFYVLLKTLPSQEIFDKTQTGITVIQWVAESTAWQDAVNACTDGYWISILMAIGFAVTIVIYRFPRAALVTSFSLLNLYFAWTSHVFAYFSQSLASFLTYEITAQDNFLSTFVNIPRGDSTLMVVDAEALAMLVMLTTLIFLFNLRKGMRTAFLHSLQVMALCCMILGIEILAFDSNEFNLHVTQIQESLNVALWFSNADLFYSSVGIFVASSFLLYFGRSRLP
jgi:hypothetical protein